MEYRDWTKKDGSGRDISTSLLGYGCMRLSLIHIFAAKGMESAEVIYRDRVLYKGEEARLQNWRVSYYYTAACFHAGRCTACLLYTSRCV